MLFRSKDRGMNGLSRTLCLFGAFILGFLFSELGEFSFLIQYIVIFVLFLAYLTMPLEGNPLTRIHFYILGINLLLGFVPFFVLRPWSSELALSAFMVGITPTAIAAPVIMALIKRNVAFAATSTLLTNTVMAFVIPLCLPMLAGQDIPINLIHITSRTFLVLLGPLVVAFGIRFFMPRLALQISKVGRYAFFIWIWAIILAVASATNYLKTQNEVTSTQLLFVAMISLLLCAFGYALGYLLGGKRFNLEASSALGQKHAMLTIWISLSYLNPFIAMGPTFYILFHHIMNGWLIIRHSGKK